MAGTSLFGSAKKGGATAAETQTGQSQYDFMQQLQKDFGTSFAGQQNIINGLTKSAQSIVAGGPSQFGFSAPELAALKSQAINANAIAARNAMTVAAQQAAAQGGGANLPAGAQGARQAQIGLQAGENLSNNLLGIQEAGYQAGRQNYQDAERTMEAAGQLENPSVYASQANNAGAEAFSSAKTIQEQNQAASPWGQVGGLVGSLAGTALNMVAPGAGTALGKLGGFVSRGNQNIAGMPTSSAPITPPQIGYEPMQSLDLSSSLSPAAGSPGYDW